MVISLQSDFGSHSESGNQPENSAGIRTILLKLVSLSPLPVKFAPRGTSMFARCLISVFLIYGASFGQQQNGSASESWKQHMDLAKQLAARGQYADAKSEYEAALRAVSELPNDGRAFLSRLGLGSVKI